MKSLRRRLNRGLAWILLTVFAFQLAVASVAIAYVAERQMSSRLEHDGDSILASLDLDASGRLQLGRDHLALVYEQAFSGHYFVIETDAQTLRSRSLLNDRLETRAAPSERAIVYHSEGPRQQPLLVWSRGLEKGGIFLQLSVAEDLTSIQRDISALRLAYLLFSAILFLAALLLQTLDIRRALRPLWLTSADLTMIASGHKTRVDCDSPEEIRPLVDEINRLLDLVERRLKQSRTAIGNLSHALKTPLAVLFQTIKDPRLEEMKELVRPIRQQVAAIQSLVERELKRARLAGPRTSGGWFQPSSDLAALVQLLESVYAEKTLNIEVAAPAGQVPYDREDMMELIGNLADNACKWAVHRVWMRVEYQELLEISVEDDGAGCAPEEIERLAGRGTRMDETKAGHGLGLAIAQDICDSYLGRLEFTRSLRLGGLRVRAALPIPAARGPVRESAA